MAIYELGDDSPSIPDSAWVAPSADLIGKVVLGEGATVWFGAVLRADNEPMRIGANSNIQDNSVVHSDIGQPTTIGDNVTIGHQVILHGCTVGDNSLIGMGTTILNGARIGRNCLVGAGSLVTEGKVFEDGWLIMGRPAKAVRELTGDQQAGLMASAEGYRKNGERYKAGLNKVG
jgi:carbonic anhydrase/acetyltransferase-like protein (isoleucine patch superfamily)